MIKQDILENQVKFVYLAIGSNLGNKRINIERAKYELSQKNIKIIISSSYYESLSWPNPKNPKFLNIVLKISTSVKPLDLLNICKEIEKKIGRKKTFKNSPRECDIDLIDYDNKIMKKGIILPHPRMQDRNFVIFPLFEINKNWIHPITKISIKKLILSLPNIDITSIKQI